MAFHSNIPPEISDKCKNVSKFPFLPLKVLEKTGASRGPAPSFMENIHGFVLFTICLLTGFYENS